MNEPEEGPPEQPMRALLGSSDFMRLWLVGAFANAMRWLELLVSGLFAYQATGSALAAAVVVALRQLPQLLFGAFAGAVAEAVNRKLLVMLALTIPAFASTVMATLATTGELALWHVALANFISGTMWSTEMSTRRRMVGEAAGPLRIVPAIALDSATNAGTRLVGPLLGGIAFELLGMKGAYTMSALVQFACAFAMAGLVYQQVAHELRLLEIPRQIAEGLSYAWTKPTILLVLGVTVITNAFAFAYSGLVAPLGLGEFRVSPTLVGLLAAAEPIGALIGGALIAGGVVRFDRRLTFAGGSSLFMVALVVMALSPSYWLAFAVLVLGGLGTAGFGNMQTTLMLTEAPAAMRSRLMGMVTVGIGTGPLGVLVAGALSEQWGPRMAVAFMAALGLAATVALALWLRRR
jgi:MFS family permease